MTQDNLSGPEQVAQALSKYLHSNLPNRRKLAVYSIYTIIVDEFGRCIGKTLAPLESHPSPDSRSKSLGDIEIKNGDGSIFEAVEIKHLKPISVDMLRVAYRKYLVSHPQAFVEEYTKWLEFEYQRASGIKKEHLQVWQEIRQKLK
jgi:DNA (cytosine-5)-methyltransferase 1